MKLLRPVQKSNSQRFFHLIVIIFSVGLAPESLTAAPVQMVSNLPGEVALVPIFDTKSNLDTLLTVSNRNFTQHTSVKLHFRGRSGNLLASANLYLADRDVWAASISSHGQESLVNSSDDGSCLLKELGGEVQSVESFTIEASIGYLEVIEMGRIEDSEIGGEILRQECEKLASRWNSGIWATAENHGLTNPIGSTRVTNELLDGPTGTLFTLESANLINFSDIAQHTRPGNAKPDLSTAHGPETDSGLTFSRVCHAQDCVISEWENPIDAVSASMFATELEGNFVIDAEIGASVEWLFLYPTRHYYSSDHPLRQADVSLYVNDREGIGRSDTICIPTGTPFGCSTTYSLEHSQSLELISFNDSLEELGNVKESSILGISYEVTIPTRDAPLPSAGVARVGLSTNGAFFPANGDLYRGMPALGFAIQQYINGFLPGQGGQLQRANYADAQSLDRVLDID